MRQQRGAVTVDFLGGVSMTPPSPAGLHKLWFMVGVCSLRLKMRTFRKPIFPCLILVSRRYQKKCNIISKI